MVAPVEGMLGALAARPLKSNNIFKVDSVNRRGAMRATIACQADFGSRGAKSQVRGGGVSQSRVVARIWDSDSKRCNEVAEDAIWNRLSRWTRGVSGVIGEVNSGEKKGGEVRAEDCRAERRQSWGPGVPEREGKSTAGPGQGRST